jgi:universal stress protein A
MNIHTILVPVDFSVCSMGVVRQAASLAAKLQGSLHIVHVGDLPPGVTPQTQVGEQGHQQAAGELLSEDAERRMERFARAAREEGVEADVAEAFGVVAPTILALAKSTGADLIVMGTHGRSGLARLMLGSVAEAVVHGADVPVMLIRSQPRPECGRQDCDWCAEGGRSQAEAQVDAERNG